jgi:CheY-like chemotaxis protein
MYVKPTILIADDEPVIRRGLTRELRASYDVLVATDGIDAISIYEHNVERVVAIITDFNMPRLNGGLVAEWVHHINPQLPVIIMSGSILITDLEDILQRPTVTFLSKPFELSELQALLNDALERKNEAA